ATAQVSGGVAPYTYLWSTNPPQTTVTASALSAQFYSLTVTDANGCSVLTSVNIPNASNMSATTSSTQTPCGMSTGTASVTVNGGTSPYTYAWNTNPVQTTQTASGLAYGSYNVTITDASGCVLNKSVYVGFVNLINVNISYTNTSCICVDPVATVTGGTAPYTYLWDDGTTNQTASCFDEGWHYVQVTDAAGCTKYKSFNVTYPANCYITLNGTVYDDANKNCILDAGENGIANTPVILSKTGFTETVLTDNNGNYSFYVLNDTFQLFHNPDPSWARNCPSAPPSYNVIVPAGSTTAFDFADTTTAYFIDVAILNCAISGRTRGFDTDYYITVKNKGNSVASGMVSAVHDAILTYVNSNPIVNTYNFTTKTASWNYVNLNPGATMQFRLTLNIPPTAPLGSVFTNNVDVTPLSTDIDPSNNTCTRSATVNGSYDPNNKINWPSGDIEVTDLWHNYLINFQNTGTAPAVRVIIEDTLDANLDFSTITDFVGSHDFVVDGSQAPIYKFIFDNINLPDSNFNEPESHGFVAFRVMRNTGVPSGTQISNTAHIFFDFNSAIITNTVVNTVIITGINENEYTSAVTVYPNPSTGILYVDFDTNYDKYKVLEIYNAFNQLVSTTEVFDNAGKIKLDLSEYSSGIYSYRLIAKDAVLNSGKISLIR
ncbi:MAG: T9SS type A sorting domain-containing protein, partial [Bacteroidia bacterium]|nr:T9SS type A sorting domain-containing protein [Bacteroidia bacterium]